MNNGDSFYNGQDDLELQKRNSLGGQDAPVPSRVNEGESTPPASAQDPTGDPAASTQDSSRQHSHATNDTAPAGTTPYYGEAPNSSAYRASPDMSSEYAQKNRFNITALILGIASFAGNIICLSCFTPITAVLAIIFGCIGRVGGKFDPKGLIGFILGIVYCALMLLSLLFIVFIVMLSMEEGMPIE